MHVKHLDPLPGDEHTTMEQMYRYHPKRRCRQRAHMVLLSSQGYCQRDVAKIMRVSVPTVADALKRYRKHGFLGLYDAPKPGTPPKRKPDLQEHREHCLDSTPREQGYHSSGWTRALMRYHLWTYFGIWVCIETMRQWFLRLGYSLIVPRYLLLKAQQEQLQTFHEHIEELLQQAKRGEMLLLCVDEATCKMVPTLTRLWAKKGTKPTIPPSEDQRKVVITGGTDVITGQTHYRLSNNASKEAAVAFLGQLRRRSPHRDIVISWDRSPAHKSGIAQAYFEDDPKRREERLPGYAPELHLQEPLWKWLRKRITHHFLFDSPKALAQAIRNCYASLYGHPERVLSLTGNV